MAMRASSVVLIAGLALTGVASAVTLSTRSSLIAAAAHEGRHAGPDSARVEAFFGALHAADPMVCDMVVDQLGNFWNSAGDDGVGTFADGTRGWEPTRDSLASPVGDVAARRRVTAALGEQNACVRRAAAKMLGRSGELAVGNLREALRAGSARVREAALLAVGHGELPSLYDEAVRGTRDADPSVAAMATWALGEYERPESVDRLAELARSGEVRIRRSAAWALGQIEDPRGIPALSALLRDADESTRALSAAGLGDIESLSAAGPLSAALRDPSVRVQIAAAAALGELDGLEAAPEELIKALSATDLLLRRAAAGALAEIADLRAVEALGRAITEPDLETRRAVVHALTQIEDDSTVPFLLRAIRDSDPEIRTMAAEALGERKEK
jgi:HEAT repeat protein